MGGAQNPALVNDKSATSSTTLAINDYALAAIDVRINIRAIPDMAPFEVETWTELS